MRNSPSPEADKTLVERRVAHSGDKARDAVKSLRAGLGSRNTAAPGVERRFLLDILRSHAKHQKRSRLGMILLACLVAYIMHFSLPLLVIAGWLVVTTLVCLIVLKSSSDYLSLKNEQIDADHWNRLFLAMHATVGICWASLFALLPNIDTSGLVSAFGFTGGLVLTGVALLTNKNSEIRRAGRLFPLGDDTGDPAGGSGDSSIGRDGGCFDRSLLIFSSRRGPDARLSYRSPLFRGRAGSIDHAIGGRALDFRGGATQGRRR